MKLPSKQEVLTTPNLISSGGFGLVVAGSIESDPAKSLYLTATGRALDLVDGPVARLTGQGSDFGAKVDAGFDKFGMAAIVAGALTHKRIPPVAAGAIIAHNAFNAAASIAHEIRHPDEPARPSKIGKVGLFVENLGVFAYMGAAAVESKRPNSELARGLTMGGHALTACGVGLGLIAGIGYLKRATNDA